ncbi:MAG: DNA (cytosine-5-)-methyltransferase [Methyloprofundus sp.]|nr:DNA (cytosine-5-)-methyltransferase [Methyloprofundus sp.]
MKEDKKSTVNTYIDLFSGCGGLSLGLGNAGWTGVFSIEKDGMAFETFKHNLIDGKYKHFDWPEWLPQKATTIQDVLKNYQQELVSLNGKVDLIVGGPPCQGFSLAGRRNPNDPRNKLSSQYIKMVGLIKPKYILLENVRGFNATFPNGKGKQAKIPYSMVVKAKLEKLGYSIFTSYVNSQDFGVPQQRTRFIMIGIRNDILQNEVKPFDILEQIRSKFLTNKGLSEKPISVKEAITDMEVASSALVHHSGTEDKGFKQIDYIPPKILNPYQKIMRPGLNGLKPNGLRLARHKQTTVDKFKLIQEICRPGFTLNTDEKAIIGTKKQVISVLDPNKPSKTLTTLPDDLIHYSEPRILTVRESARIQSFPDDFVFTGKYTTGGDRRTKECPKYTQVGNAVPPLLGEVLGILLIELTS